MKIVICDKCKAKETGPCQFYREVQLTTLSSFSPSDGDDEYDDDNPEVDLCPACYSKVVQEMKKLVDFATPE